MKYSELRAHIQTGDVIAWQGITPLGSLVRAVTGEDYAHIGLVWRGYDRVFVLHARPFRGVVLEPLSRMLPAYWLRTPAYWTDELGKTAFEKLGLAYSIKDAVRAGFGMNVNDDEHYQCAEYVGDLLRLGGVNIPEFTTATPGQLVKALDVSPQPLFEG